VKGDWQAGISFGITDTVLPTYNTHSLSLSLAQFALHSQMVSGTVRRTQHGSVPNSGPGPYVYLFVCVRVCVVCNFIEFNTDNLSFEVGTANLQ